MTFCNRNPCNQTIKTKCYNYTQTKVCSASAKPDQPWTAGASELVAQGYASPFQCHHFSSTGQAVTFYVLLVLWYVGKKLIICSGSTTNLKHTNITRTNTRALLSSNQKAKLPRLVCLPPMLIFVKGENGKGRGRHPKPEINSMHACGSKTPWNWGSHFDIQHLQRTNTDSFTCIPRNL